MATTLGVVTVGQAPRSDLTPELAALLPAHCRIVEHGALDGLSTEELAALRPRPGEHALASRLADGSSVVFGHDQSLPLVEKAIARAEDDGADAVLLVCSGSFPDLGHRVPLLLVERLAHHAVAALGVEPRIGIIRPLPEQLADARSAWKATLGRDVAAADAASPYVGAGRDVPAAAARIADEVDVIVLDCIGYDEPMRHAAARASGRPTLLVRGLAARITAEFLAAGTVRGR